VLLALQLICNVWFGSAGSRLTT